jgi:rsbT co-antagonist protein RsbR
MRSLRTLLFGIAFVQTLIIVLTVAFMLYSIAEQDRLVAQTRHIQQKADYAQQIVTRMLKTRNVERDYLVALSSPSSRFSPTELLAKWQASYITIGETFTILEPFMQSPNEQEQLKRWRRFYNDYQLVMNVIQTRATAAKGAEQFAYGHMTAFDTTLNQLADETAEYAQAQTQTANQAWNQLVLQEQRTMTILWSVGIAVCVFTLGLGWLVANWLPRPLMAMVEQVEQVSSGNLAARVVVEGQHELGRLGRAFNHMVTQISGQREAILSRSTELEQANQQQQTLLQQLQDSLAQRNQLEETLREVSVPVIPLLKGVLVVPLIGSFDDKRANDLRANVLRLTEQNRAQHIILDVTGVPIIDTHVAGTILGVVSALRLLGATPMLVGIRPEVAQALVHLGVQFQQLRTYADLQSAVADLMRQHNLKG